jgi:hypothetical protein
MSDINKLFFFGTATGLFSWWMSHRAEEQRIKYENMRRMKIWSVDELICETLENNINPHFPMAPNNQDYSKFDQIAINGLIWCDESQRVRSDISERKQDLGFKKSKSF